MKKHNIPNIDTFKPPKTRDCTNQRKYCKGKFAIPLITEIIHNSSHARLESLWIPQLFVFPARPVTDASCERTKGRFRWISRGGEPRSILRKRKKRRSESIPRTMYYRNGDCPALLQTGGRFNRGEERKIEEKDWNDKYDNVSLVTGSRHRGAG